MDYIDLLKRSYQLTIKNRFLWIFGLFAGGAGIISGLNSGFNQSNPEIKSFLDKQASTDQIINFYHLHSLAIISAGIGIVLLCILMFILSLLSQGALISAGDKLDNDQKPNFWSSLKVGANHFWRLWGLMIVYGVIFSIVVGILGSPVLVLVATKGYSLAIAWGIIGLIVVFLLALLLGVMAPYNYRLLILANKSIIRSLRETLHFVRDHFNEVILAYLLLIAVGLVFVMAFVLALIIVTVALVLLGIALWFAFLPLGILYTIIVSIAYLIMLIVIGGAYSAFKNVYLTLAYNRIKKL